jgi:indole-3-glycerol phosphate synthase
MKKQLTLTLEANTYQEAKEIIPTGQVSPLINSLLEEYLKKRKRERLIASYKKTASSKTIKAEDKIWEDAVADGIGKK